MFEATPCILLRFPAPLDDELMARVGAAMGSTTRVEEGHVREGRHLSAPLLADVSIRAEPPPFGSRYGDHMRRGLPPLRDRPYWLVLRASRGGAQDDGSLPGADAEAAFVAAAWRVAEAAGASAAYGDVAEGLERSAPPDPDARAWPVMLLPPSEVARLGPSHVRDAPARVELLPEGGARLSVGERPFHASRRAVGALARHLGRRPPL